MIRRCKFCGKKFETKKSRQIYCDNPHHMNCPVCGKEYVVKDKYLLGEKPKCCSKECSSIMRASTSLERYGCTSPGNSIPARNKAKSTIRQRYGVDFPMQSKDIRTKAERSFHNTIWNRKFGDIVPEQIDCSDMNVYILKEDFAEKFIRTYCKDLFARAKLYAGLVKDNELYRCISFNPYENHRLVIVQDCSLPQYDIIDGDKKIFQELTINYDVYEIGYDC